MEFTKSPVLYKAIREAGSVADKDSELARRPPTRPNKKKTSRNEYA